MDDQDVERGEFNADARTKAGPSPFATDSQHPASVRYSQTPRTLPPPPSPPTTAKLLPSSSAVQEWNATGGGATVITGDPRPDEEEDEEEEEEEEAHPSSFSPCRLMDLGWGPSWSQKAFMRL